MAILYNTEEMKSMLESLYHLSNIRIVVYNNKFEKIDEVPDHDCNFCSLIRKDKNALERCLASDRYACEKCREQNAPYSYTCHAGLTETVAPIQHKNIVIGYLMFGQVLQQTDKALYWEEIHKRCKGYDVDMEDLYAAYCEKQPVTQEQIYAAARLLEACAGNMWLQRYISLKKDDLLFQICDYITNHLEEDLSVPALCKRFNSSRSRLYRIIYKYSGCGIGQFIRRLRVERAKELLSADVSVSEVANRVGYTDYNYFIKVFKRETGITPVLYKKRNET